MSVSGKKWVKIVTIIAIVIACLVGSGYLALEYLVGQLTARLAGCTLENQQFTSTVNFDYVGKWIVVKARVNGSEKEFEFIFDSGAQTVFSDSLFKELGGEGFQTTQVQTDTENHAFRSEIIVLDKLELGDVVFRDIGAMVVNSKEYGMLNCVSPYGIIGYNVLQTCGLQIDYEKGQIVLTDQLEKLNSTGGVEWLPYTTLDQETPIIEAVIDDSIKVRLFFDTGFSGGLSLTSTALFDAIRSSYPDRTAIYSAKSSITIRGDDSAYQALKFTPSSFRLGNLTNDDLVLSVKNGDEREFTGLIGNEYLEKFIITLDYQNKRVGFTPQAGLEKQADKSTFGLNFTPLDNKIYVNQVYHGSQADSQGLSIGDEIVSINGVSIVDLPPETFCDIYTYRHQLVKATDSLLILETNRNGKIDNYELARYMLPN